MYTRGLHVNDLAVLQGLTGLVVLFLFSAIPFFFRIRATGGL